MKRMRVYFDTSALGGCFDAEFREASRRLIKAAYGEQIVPLISEILVRELTEAPAHVRQLLVRLMQGDIERLEVNRTWWSCTKRISAPPSCRRGTPMMPSTSRWRW